MNNYFNVNRYTYREGKTTTNKPSIRRHSPYDLQEYHWAYKEKSNDGISKWVIAREKKIEDRIIVNSDLMTWQEELEYVANKCLEHDKAKNLKKRIDMT